MFLLALSMVIGRMALHAGALSAFNIASLESDEKGLSYDADGNIEYDDEGYAVLDEYAEMCGGRDADEECYECFECSKGGNRCVPISGCVPHCEVDDDCTREQICVDGEFVCRLPGGRPGGYRDSSSDDASRKGKKGKRGDSSDSSSWGGPAQAALSAHAEFQKVARATEINIAWLEAQEKGFSYDASGEIEYDDEGYAVLDTYVEMCGGKDADQECYECFECSRDGHRCIPIEGCVPHCEVDDECTRVQLCVDNGYDNDPVCRLPNGRWELDRRGERVELNEGFMVDMDGNVEYDEDGYAKLVEYAEMCGGPDADEECFECFECNRGGNRCIPISGCVPTCQFDEDCTREQICVDEEFVCRLPGGRPSGGYRDSSDDAAGTGSKRKGGNYGKGMRGSSDSDDDDDASSSWGGPTFSGKTFQGKSYQGPTLPARFEAAVMMETEIEREGQNVNHVTLLWCSLAAVALLAAGALMRYLRAAAPKKVERSSHLMVGGETFF